MPTDLAASLCGCLWGTREDWAPGEGEAEEKPEQPAPGQGVCVGGARLQDRCGWLESTGVRHRGRNVPGMLGAAYLDRNALWYY